MEPIASEILARYKAKEIKLRDLSDTDLEKIVSNLKHNVEKRENNLVRLVFGAIGIPVTAAGLMLASNLLGNKETKEISEFLRQNIIAYAYGPFLLSILGYVVYTTTGKRLEEISTYQAAKGILKQRKEYETERLT